ncbi:MAG: hypothetical protein ACPGN3_15645 [Opitutales bacterium]
MKKSAITTAAALSVSTFVNAIELDDIYFSGTLSTTVSYSTDYAFYSEEADSLDLSIVEFIYNGMYQFDNGVQVGAQLYAYTLDGVSDIALDWGGVSYQYRPEFGVSLGRNKLYNGLHNHTQDLDVVRTFASPSLVAYGRSLRPITASLDGIAIGGNIELGALGAFEYRLNAGFVDSIPADSYMILNSFNDFTTYNGLKNSNLNYAAWGAWSTPIDGLKIGASFVYYPDFEVTGSLEYTNNLTGTDLARASDIGASIAPILPVPGLTGAEAWDLALAGTESSLYDNDYLMYYGFIEYVWNDLTLSAEFTRNEGYTRAFIPALGATSSDLAPLARLHAHYLEATYQFSDKLSAGIQYSEYDGNYQTDNNETEGFTVAVSYWLTDFLLLKGEAHAMDGTTLIGQSVRGVDLSANDSWEYFVFKSTLSF